MTRRLIVIGAGPIGLEAALAACERGFDVTVLEAGRIGESLRRWGDTRLFSPVSMNVSERALRVLGPDAPPPDALLTGAEMIDRVLVPLATRPPLDGRVRLGHRVAAVGRQRMTRRDMPGNPVRTERPFRLIADTPEGERVFEAEVVLDASGNAQPLALGVGGLPAIGERAVADRIIRHLGDLQEKLPEIAGKRLLLIGHGHSAANAMRMLDRLAREYVGTRVTWAVRTLQKRPCIEVASDPLPERQQVVSLANDLAQTPPPWLRVERRAHVESIEVTGSGRLAVELSGGRKDEHDFIAAFTGYRPDHSFLGELALEVSPSSEGTARVTAALCNVTDCLSIPRLRPEDLASGEPGFHLIGAKSYGRLPSFLLKNGREQVEAILDALAPQRAKRV